jgi:aspartate/methionine/tyrosine aminotransferase
MLTTMNPLAQELNEKLAGTALLRMLSATGRAMYFPKGIVAQSAEANARATRFNATVGMAFENGEPMMLGGVRAFVGPLHSAEVVAYAPTPGVAELRDLWKEAMVRKNPGIEGLATTRPLVTGGLTNGLFQLAELFVDPGDAVITPDLFWGNYRLMFEVRRNGKLVTFPLFSSTGGFNVEGLAGAMGPHRKSVVLLNFPNNPTGYSPTAEEASAIVLAIRKHAEAGNDVLVICDDAYFGLFYEEGLYTESLFGAAARAHPNVVAAKVDGATKEDFAWGFRIGFLTLAGAGLGEAALGAIERKLMGNIRASVSNSSRIAQSLLLAMHAASGYSEEKAGKRDLLRARYRKVREIVSGTPSGTLKPLPFNSGYFMSFDCTGISAEDLRLRLLDRGIGTISIQGRYLRVAYSAVDESDLPELYAEIYAAADELSGAPAEK